MAEQGGVAPRIVAREGDVLVVSYPEIKLPITRFTNLTVGGLTYSRKLVAGDDPQVEYDRIYAFLRVNAVKDGREKFREYSEEIHAAQQPKPLAPKPPGLPPKPAGAPR